MWSAIVYVIAMAMRPGISSVGDAYKVGANCCRPAAGGIVFSVLGSIC